MGRIINRDPPSWQNQKLILAERLVEQNNIMIAQHLDIINILRKIEAKL